MPQFIKPSTNLSLRANAVVAVSQYSIQRNIADVSGILTGDKVRRETLGFKCSPDETGPSRGKR